MQSEKGLPFLIAIVVLFPRLRRPRLRRPWCVAAGAPFILPLAVHTSFGLSPPGRMNGYLHEKLIPAVSAVPVVP
jgi:hypothetical protein